MTSETKSDVRTKRYGKFAVHVLVVATIIGLTFRGVGYAYDHYGALAVLPVLAVGYLATIVAEHYLTGDGHD